jgi:hypothetical protein
MAAPLLLEGQPVMMAHNTRMLANETASDEEAVCKGARDAFYATDLERENDPCDCSYDAVTGSLGLECRYDYCPECNEEYGVCGIRIVNINHVLDEESILAYYENGEELDIGDSKEYCVEYTDAGRGSKEPVCTTIANNFNTGICVGKQFTDLEYGLPLLTCSEKRGCQCAGAAIDPSSPFIGFETLKFETCYDPSATAPTMLSAATTACYSWRLLVSLILFLPSVRQIL